MMRKSDSFDEDLTSVNPSNGPPPPSSHRRSERRKTEAWSETDAGVQSATATTTAASTPPPTTRTKKALHKTALLMVFLQALWALLVPVKNIATIFFPSTRSDAIETTTLNYQFPTPNAITTFPGSEIMALLDKVLEITLSNDLVRYQLQSTGTFDIDAIQHLLSFQDFEVLAQYYTLVFQASEFPGATFTKRSMGSNATLDLLLRDAANVNADISLTLGCGSDYTMMKAVRCTDANGWPCAPGSLETGAFEKLHDANLHDLGSNTGLYNNIGLLFVVDYFHQAMSTLVASKDWNATLENLNFEVAVESALETSALSALENESIPLLYDRDAFLLGIQAAEMQTTQLDSCFASELVVGHFFTRRLVLHRIQKALIPLDLYQAASQPLISLPSTLDRVLAPMFQSNIQLTSGARFSSRGNRLSFYRQIGAADVTTFQAQFKLGSMATRALGSSMRLVQSMVFYPGLLSRFESTMNYDHDIQVYKLLGGAPTGIFMFKDAVSATSMRIFPLFERPRDSEDSSQWDEEIKLASFYRNLEASTSSSSPLELLNTHLAIRVAPTQRVMAGDDSMDAMRCHRSLLKVLGKIAFLALVRMSRPASYLMLMSENGLDTRLWLLNQLHKEELVLETFSGERIAFPYRSGPSASQNDGSNWVIWPLLHAMTQANQGNASQSLLPFVLQELDDSFRSIVKASSGNLVFPDGASCRITGKEDSSVIVSDSDSIEQLYQKLYSGLSSTYETLLTSSESIVSQLTKVAPAQALAIDPEQITGNDRVPMTAEGLGAPIEWKSTLLRAGLLKFWPSKTPPVEVLRRADEVTVCYNALELMSLGLTIRCFVEPYNVQLRRTMYESEPLRKFLLSNWSMGIMLNTMAGFVVFKYFRKLLKAYRITQFECLNLEVALQLNLQGHGVLTSSQCLLLLLASGPSLIGFHLPSDPIFLPYLESERLPKLLIDSCVTLSMSWFVKLGFDVSNRCVRPHKPIDWYHHFRLRWFCLLVIFVARAVTPDRPRHGDFQALKLLVTISVSMGLGALCVAAIYLPERRGKVVDERQKDHDQVLAALVKQNLPLNRYGVLGRTSKGWSKTGLIVEGWRLAKTRDGNDVLRKDGGEIPLPSDLEPSETTAYT